MNRSMRQQTWFRMLWGVWLGVGFVGWIWAEEGPPAMVQINGGLHRRMEVLPGDPKWVEIKSFFLDRYPVTNGQFLMFVKENEEWRKSAVIRLFADENYLKHWEGDLTLGGDARERQPVVWVSWFAAMAYADWCGKRLATVDEWEYAATASRQRLEGWKDEAFVAEVARWYSTPSPEVLPEVGMGKANFLGVWDLHGLVWEWTLDFNSALVSGDSRSEGGRDRELFCGGGAAYGVDPSNFPYFMRQGMRSSLKAGYTMRHLGFRCAKDL